MIQPIVIVRADTYIEYKKAGKIRLNRIYKDQFYYFNGCRIYVNCCVPPGELNVLTRPVAIKSFLDFYEDHPEYQRGNL